MHKNQFDPGRDSEFFENPVEIIGTGKVNEGFLKEGASLTKLFTSFVSLMVAVLFCSVLRAQGQVQLPEGKGRDAVRASRRIAPQQRRSSLI